VIADAASRHQQRELARKLVKQSRALFETCKRVKEDSALAIARAQAIQEIAVRSSTLVAGRVTCLLGGSVPKGSRLPSLVAASLTMPAPSNA
jgi:hypothetical protein